jgi:hypothetical protein
MEIAKGDSFGYPIEIGGELPIHLIHLGLTSNEDN